ncbi:hypothetical protein PY365_13935 [Roseiarcaceae bacterium H3SJ34-1]|uniref:hypothetical protein n=1 Tax=Terripilifer ovatus TaxID=3032367 RepID=UPI003AB9B995|nr:hypothetical protein [Roseiarcaceae bacterium H3SJ34-1]
MPEIDEIDAMKQIAELMEKLDESARIRALDWVMSKYGLARPMAARISPSNSTADGPHSNSSGTYDSFAELFDAAQPAGDRDKALVAAFWTQVCMNAESFPSQMLNDQLKDLGHRISNITDALTRLKIEKPALVLQLKKSGTTKQARKTYKLTQEGIRRVNTMIAANSDSETLS